MKRHKLLVTLALLLALTSCKKQPDLDFTNQRSTIELSQEEYLSIAFDNPKELEESDIKVLVNDFINEINKDGIATKGSNRSIEIKRRELVSTNENGLSINGKKIPNIRLPVYELSVKVGDNKEDIAIVSADERAPMLLAYYMSGEVPEGSEASDVNAAPNQAALELSLHSMNEKVLYIEYLKDSLRQSTLQKVSKTLSIDPEEVSFAEIKDRLSVLGVPRTKANLVQNPFPINGTVTATYGPLLLTRWSKGMPYNRKFPQSCPSNWLWDNRPAVGSMTVSVAQILAYFMPPLVANGTTMDWMYLTVNPEIHENSDYFGGWVQDPLLRRNMVADLMVHVTSQCAISWTCTGSTVNFNNVRNFLSSRGILLTTQSSINYSTVVSSLQNFRPVLMYGQTSTGGGHWWIVDGIIAYHGSLGLEEYYLHANMNEGSSYTGYYFTTKAHVNSITYNPGFAHFIKNFQLHTDIRM